MKYTLIYIGLILSIPLRGQMIFHEDTIKISEVIINRKIQDARQPGFKLVTIDSSIIDNYSHGTLAEVLSENSSIFIKSYGMGGTATPSFRGTGAGHTQTTWNGININYPMSGQSDLSLIPVGMIDDIQIYFGGASMSVSTGGIGGIINLESRPDWKNETSVSVSAGMGSFGQYNGLARLKMGNAHFQTHTKAFFNSADNNFRYLNDVSGSEPVWETRKNSQVNQKGFAQELYFRKSNSSTSARVWYQSAHRNLPSSMLVQQFTGEKQDDESLRTMITHELFRGSNNYSFTGAFLWSSLDYDNSLASIASRNISETMVLNAKMERAVSAYSKIKISVNDELSVSKTTNYNRNKTRNTGSVTASLERTGPGGLGTLLLLREVLDDGKVLVPDFSAGLQYRLTKENRNDLRASLSRNSKLPSMNDLYWIPGGNPDLKSENALTWELGYDMSRSVSGSSKFSFSLTGYRNLIKDMIQWHPGQFSYWTADNIQSVTTTGLESSVSFTVHSNDFESRITAGYSYTRAIDNGKDDGDAGRSQLIYIPENQINANVNLSWRRVYTRFITNMTGVRYTTADNTRSLPAYVLNSIMTGYRLKPGDYTIDFNFNIDNLFNVDYMTIAYYPLPGRTYSVKILFQLIK